MLYSEKPDFYMELKHKHNTNSHQFTWAKGFPGAPVT